MCVCVCLCLAFRSSNVSLYTQDTAQTCTLVRPFLRRCFFTYLTHSLFVPETCCPPSDQRDTHCHSLENLIKLMKHLFPNNDINIFLIYKITLALTVRYTENTFCPRVCGYLGCGSALIHAIALQFNCSWTQIADGCVFHFVRYLCGASLRG